MKLIRKVLVYGSLTIVVVGLLAAAGLALTGLPAPPSLEAQGVSRIPWKWVWRNVGLVRSMQLSTTVAAWDPERSELLVVSEQRIHRIGAPGAPAEVVEALPRFAKWPRFSPEGDRRRLVYSLDEGGSELYRHYLLDLASGQSSSLTPVPARTTPVVFSPEGGRIVFSSTARNGSDFDLYLKEIDAPGEPQLVYRSEGAFLPEAWSPAGDVIVGGEALSMEATRPFLFEVATGEMHPLVAGWEPTASFSEPEWSPDGRFLYFLTDQDAEYVQIRRLSRASAEVETLSPDLGWDVNEIELSPDGRHLVFLLNDEGIPQLHVMDVASLETRKAEGQPAGVIRGLEMHSQNNVVAFNVVSPAARRYVGAYQLDRDRFLRWTDPGDEEAGLPPLEVVHYPTFDQVDGKARRISAYLFPAEASFEGPRPVLVDIHGGPAQQASPTPALYHQAVRGVGISVVRPNVRGSAGYGKTFLTLDNGRRREDAVRDVGALLDWIATRPDLDPERVAVIGGSYGGYMTLASLVHYSDRVRCGIDLFGISSFVTFLEASREQHFVEVQRAEYGDERDPEMREFLRMISPLHHAEKITVPLLVFQGLNDVRVKAEESRQIVERVRANGGEVWYLEAANEGHGLERPLNQLYFGSAMATFLERYLLR